MVSKKIKLLIVDDEKDVCRFLGVLFRRRGFTVYTALSGKEAIKIARKAKPDMALLDIYLKKGMNGFQALRKIREFLPQCRCAMITWDKAEEKIREARHIGAVAYLTKPLTINELSKWVNKLVRQLKKKGGKSNG